MAHDHDHAKHFLDAASDNLTSKKAYDATAKAMQQKSKKKGKEDLHGKVFREGYLRHLAKRAQIKRISQGPRDDNGKVLDDQLDSYKWIDRLVYQLLAAPLYDAMSIRTGEKGQIDDKTSLIIKERHVVAALQKRGAIGVGSHNAIRRMVKRKL